jgi:N-terminal domain of anti-restriction factor ArdC
MVREPKRKPLISRAALLNEAAKKHGFIHEAYGRFHNYSLGNQLLAFFQCMERGVQPGLLATWPRWKELGRYVKRGEKALTLCMPVNCKRTRTLTKADGGEQDEEFTFTRFTHKAHWFVLAKTEGAEYKPTTI